MEEPYQYSLRKVKDIADNFDSYNPATLSYVEDLDAIEFKVDFQLTFNRLHPNERLALAQTIQYDRDKSLMKMVKFLNGKA
mgnify:CR=1 FL=1